MRQSAAEIDHAILDVAAGLFATHGFAHASVQQIADAVGYSKPGLLHRFGSKEALHRAVLDEVSATAEQLVGHAVALRGQPVQATRVLELTTLQALARPGMVQLMLKAFASGGMEGMEAIEASGRQLVDALDRGGSRERLRLVLALDLIVTGALAQQPPGDPDLHVEPDELVPMLLRLATDVLGPAPA